MPGPKRGVGYKHKRNRRPTPVFRPGVRLDPTQVLDSRREPYDNSLPRALADLRDGVNGIVRMATAPFRPSIIEQNQTQLSKFAKPARKRVRPAKKKGLRAAKRRPLV